METSQGTLRPLQDDERFTTHSGSVEKIAHFAMACAALMTIPLLTGTVSTGWRKPLKRFELAFLKLNPGLKSGANEKDKHQNRAEKD